MKGIKIQKSGGKKGVGAQSEERTEKVKLSEEHITLKTFKNSPKGMSESEHKVSGLKNQARQKQKRQLTIEDVTRRSSDTKHFRQEDGSYIVQYFNEPIHYFDNVRARFLDIDNNLIYKKKSDDDQDFAGFENIAGEYKIKLADGSDKNLCIIEKGQYCVKWQMKESVKKHTIKPKYLFSADTSSNASKRNNEALFEDFAENADLQYIIKSGKVKENIIVKAAAQNYEYEFLLETRNLRPKLSSDGQTLDFIAADRENEDKVFSIPAPFMIDAEGVTSDEVYYDITETENNRYDFKIIASKEWIEESARVYPITVDPTIVTSPGQRITSTTLQNKKYSKDRFKDLYGYTQNYRNIQYKDAGENNPEENRMYARFNLESSFFMENRIIDAKLKLYIKSINMNIGSMADRGNAPFFVYKASHGFNNPWSRSTTSFFDHENGRELYCAEDEIIDTIPYEAKEKTFIDIDVTRVLGSYASARSGIVIKPSRYIEYDTQYVTFASENVEGSEQPVLEIRYIPLSQTTGSESYTNSVKRAGTSSVDLFNGNIKFVHIDKKYGGDKLPLEISHVFRSDCNAMEDIYGVASLRSGKGWRMNIQQYLTKIELGSSADYDIAPAFRYLDQYGDEHIFNKVRCVRETGGQVNKDYFEYVDEKGTGLKCNESGTQITDKNGTILEFGLGRLTKIADKYGNCIVIYYVKDSDKINYICDAASRYIYFYYNAAGKLSSIKYDDNAVTTFNYENNNVLKSIIDSDNSETKFIYGESDYALNANHLTRVTDCTGYFIKIKYLNNNKVCKISDGTNVKKITSSSVVGYTLSADGKSKQDGKAIQFEYADNITSVKTESGKIGNYIFSEMGQCMTKYVSFGENITDFEHKRVELYDASVMKPFIGSANLIGNGNFEISPNTEWMASGLNADITSCDGIISENKMYIESAYNENSYVFQNIPKARLTENGIKNGDVLIFSGFGKADSLMNSTDKDAKFQLRAELYYNNSTLNKVYSAEFDYTVKSKWQFTANSFKLENFEALNEIVIYLDYSKNINRALFDRISLNKGSCSATKSMPLIYVGADIYEVEDITKIKYNDSDHLFNKNEELSNSDKKLLLEDILSMQAEPGMIIKNGKVKDNTNNLSSIIIAFSNNKTSNLFNAEISYAGITEMQNDSGSAKVYTNKFGNIIKSIIVNETGSVFTTNYEYDSYKDLVSECDDYRKIEKFYPTSANAQTQESVLRQRGDTTKNKVVNKRQLESGKNYLKYAYDERYKDETENYIYSQTEYNVSKDQLDYAVTANGQKINYTYNNRGQLIGISTHIDGSLACESTDGAACSHTECASINYGYTRGLLTTMTGSGNAFEFEYDGFGRLTKVTLNGVEISGTEYSEGTYSTSEISTFDACKNVLSNGWTGKEIYDKLGRLCGKYITSNEGQAEYKALGVTYKGETEQVDEITDNYMTLVSGAPKEVKTKYNYKDNGEVDSVEFSGYRSGKIKQNKDGEGRQISTNYTLGGVQNYSYNYETATNGKSGTAPDNRLVSVTLPSGNKSEYGYDDLGRLKTKKIALNYSVTESYNYLEGGRNTEYVTVPRNRSGYCEGEDSSGGSSGGGSSGGGDCGGGSSGGGGILVPKTTYDRTTNFIKTINYTGSYNATDNLQYDSNGNITSRTCGSNGITYKYDGLDRLIRENNQYLGKTFKFQYDVNGNILSVKTCNYTTASEETNLVTASYSYDSSKRLNKISYTSGASVNFGEYDSLGNPRNYKGNNLVWTRGRMLKQYGTKASYLYDANGIRQEKTVSGTMHSYYTDGDKIIAEKVGENTREYYYDASGIVGIKYNGSTYYLQKNIHGDVERIFDTNGSLAGSYKYDAWGNHKTYKRINGTDIDITENMGYNSDILKVNPFRYRGYYYDVETNLYYLNSRYYDPDTRRFINSDDISYLEPETLGGLNLYSYCGNNPVMNIDPDGHAFFSILLLGFLIGGVISATIGGVSAAVQGKSGLEILGATVGGFILGGALGAATFLGGALGAGVLAATAGNILGGLAIASVGTFAAGMGAYAAEQGISGKDIDIGTMFAHGGIAAVQGLVSFGIGAVMGGAGMWNSLKTGNGFVSTVKGTVQNAVSHAGKTGFKTAVSGVARGVMTYSKNNLGWMIGRAIYKSFFVQPWGIIRWAL